jgi:hypothetical protein
MSDKQASKSKRRKESVQKYDSTTTPDSDGFAAGTTMTAPIAGGPFHLVDAFFHHSTIVPGRATVGEQH